MTDINKLIEEEAKKYAANSYGCDDDSKGILYNETLKDYKAGANFILSKWQEENRWRKFATDDLPKIGQQIVCKSTSGRYHLANPISNDGIHWLAENFIEWKPIE